MALSLKNFQPELRSRFKTFHELMSRKVDRILLVSTPYDAWIVEEDCRLSERIVNEYRGLNLSSPPRLTWVADSDQALKALASADFDMAILMTGHDISASSVLGRQVKKHHPDLPVILLCHEPRTLQAIQETPGQMKGLDRTFLWSGNTDLLVALIKSVEDRMNAAHDTKYAGIRVILLVEDSPAYLSSLLPILYRELVVQTQAVMEDVLNEEHRLLAMRARPKILIARSFDDALTQYETYEPYILGVISDVRYPNRGRMDDFAGVKLLKRIKKDRFDVPLLLTSSEPSNRSKADKIPAIFVDKNSPTLHAEVHSFFMNRLGFGEFIFKSAAGAPIARANNLRSLEKHIAAIPEDAFANHCNCNDFSRWLFARSEIDLANTVRPFRGTEFPSIEKRRQHLLTLTHKRRMARQNGVVVNFDAERFDVDTHFFKIGNGSLGGKARGLAFASTLLHGDQTLAEKYPGVRIFIPRSLVITTEGFETFVETNGLKSLAKSDLPDSAIAVRFLEAEFPAVLTGQLKAYLAQVKYPLAVRSSGLLEDAQFMAYAGLYKTYMLPNNDRDLMRRVALLITAIKLIYASTYFQNPKAFAKRVGHRTEEEKMGVIIQQLVGRGYGNNFYPAISGVAQSYNYYPFGKMKPEQGIATIALGLGKTVMEGAQTLRFSPHYPQLLPQRSNVSDILSNSQRWFYALRRDADCDGVAIDEDTNLVKRDIVDAVSEPAVRDLVGTYVPQEDRIRDRYIEPGSPVLTFANILKHNLFPLSGILKDAVAMGQAGMGCPVEMEFSANLGEDKEHPPEFAILQLRPMTARADLSHVTIGKHEIERAFCYSTQALGNAINRDMVDIVFVKPDAFDPGCTKQIAHEIGQINSRLRAHDRKYLLIGPGRWGSADHWLGIPVNWSDISNVGAIVETAGSLIKADPSQGSHFFHNITTQGINYITISECGNDFIDWHQITERPIETETRFVAQIRTRRPFTLKVDGRDSKAIIKF